MYNWSVDEKRFNIIKELINFLKAQPETKEVLRSNIKDEYGNIVLKVKLSNNIHPVRKFYIAKYIQEKIDNLKISVIDY